MSASGKYKRPIGYGEDYKSFPANKIILSSKPPNTAKRYQDLAQQLNKLTAESADSFELTAHLEVLGISDADAQTNYGFKNVFSLAESLFLNATQRPIQSKQKKLPKSNELWRQGIILVGVLGTLALQQANTVSIWPLTLFLIVWSIASSGLIQKARVELTIENRKALFGLIMLVGIVGIGVFTASQLFLFASIATGLLWLAINACLWLEDLLDLNRLYLPALLLGAFCMLAAFGFPVSLISFFLILFSIVLLFSYFVAPSAELWEWFYNDPLTLPVNVAYASGFGLLLIVVLNQYPNMLLLSSLSLIVFLFLAEWATVGLQHDLSKAMQLSKSNLAFEQNTLSSVRASIIIVTAFSVLTLFLILQWLVPSLSLVLSHLVLFGFCMMFSIMLFSLHRPLIPSFTFLLAALAVSFGAPVVWVLVGLALVLSFILFSQLKHLEDYGFYIIS